MSIFIEDSSIIFELNEQEESNDLSFFKTKNKFNFFNFKEFEKIELK